MNSILKDVISVVSGILGGVAFYFFKDKIFNKAKTTAKTVILKKVVSAEEMAKAKDLYEGGFISKSTYEELLPHAVAVPETFDAVKAVTGLTKINDPVLWMKDISSIFNLRKIMIYLAILGVIATAIFGYGYYKGKINKPVQIAVNAEMEFTIPVPNSPLALHHGKNSTTLEWINLETGRVVATVKVKDIPELQKILKPYGFRFKPFVTVGGSLGEKKTGFEAGAGIDFFKWFKWNANAFITNLGGYLGVGYNITDNFDIMLGVGKGFSGDNRVGLFGKFKF